MKRLKVLGVVALAALLPVLPYAFKGYAGHDFLYHMTSWLGVKDAWQGGQLFPTWSAESNFRLGDPRFCFYPPVSLLLGGVSTVLLPDLLAPAAFVWVCFVIAGLAMYFACRPFVEERDRLAAAILYMLGPYLIMTSLVRFAAAELLVQAWLPLIFLWLYQATWQREQAAVLKLGCVLGLSWLTDVPASIMLVYGLLPVTAVCVWAQRSGGAAVRFALAECVGAALAAFYLGPVWVERRWIEMKALLDDDPRLSLIFTWHGMAQPNYVLASWLFACAGVAMLAACLAKRRSPLRGDRPTQTWVCLAGASFVFQLPISGLLWRYVPQMSAVQFPYRFLPLIWLALPLVLFARGTRPRARWPVYALTIALSCFPFFAYVRAQSSPRMRTAPLQLLESQWKSEGYMGKPEYVQPGVSRPATPPHLAAAAVMNEGGRGPCRMVLEDSRVISRTLGTEAPGECVIRLATYYFPYWRATDESGTVLTSGKDRDGILLVTVPPGKHTVHVVFHPASAVRSSGAAISIASLLAVMFGLVHGRMRRSGRSMVIAAAAR